MWTDNETTEDLLGFKVHAELIKEVILHDNILPVTIGVFGDWGSGKSSVLRVLEEEFKNQKEDDSKSICLFFNSWTFEGYDDAKAALIESILEELEKNQRFVAQVSEETDKLKGKARSLIGSVKWMRLLGMGFKNIALPAAAAYFTGGLSLIPYLAQSLGKLTDKPEELLDKLKGEKAEEFLKEIIEEQKNSSDLKEKSQMIREFREDFKKLIAETDIDRLIVIIDDLDRCSTDRLIENLEAIKLFLNVEKTAFIIGADPRLVRHAIKTKYGYKGAQTNFEDGNERIVDDYLEKLIQIPYYLPKLSDSEVKTYLSLLLCNRHLASHDYEKVLQAYGKLVGSNRYATYDYAAIRESCPDIDQNAILSKELSSIPALASIISETLYGNPRQIKRFLNAFMLRKRLAEVAGMQDFEGQVLAKLMVLEYAEEALFRTLYNWQIAKEGFPDEIREMEEACKDKAVTEAKSLLSDKYIQWRDKEKMIRWLQIEPMLSKVDLRDYFWISRDRIASIIPSNVMIPQRSREIFNALLNAGAETAKVGIIKELVPTLDGLHLDGLYKLIKQKITIDPKVPDSYILLSLMVANGIENSVSTLLEVVATIPKTAIPPQIILRIQNLRKNDFDAYLQEYEAEMLKSQNKR